ncbi:MAG: hypothetical protein JW804_06725 [Sedimentisphaerales bacterium]|nr:hypothetical protein [Sedimentisphaerales bacterium]
MKARKQYKISNRMLVVWLTLTGIILLLTPQTITGKFQGAFTHIFRYPLRLGRGISLSARVVDQPNYDLARREIQYQNHIANLVAELEEKNSQIEKLAGIRYHQHSLEGAALVMADVINVNLQGSRNEIIINRGQSDGLKKGQLVIGENSIIGVVDGLWLHQAKVTLTTDSSFRLPVMVEGLKKSVWMFGCGSGRAIIRWANDKPDIGQEVLTEKKPGFLDCPMVIGRVSGCNRNADNALLWDITVAPACDIAMLPSVMVIVMNPTPKVEEY